MELPQFDAALTLKYAVMHITGLDLVPLAQKESIVRKGRDEVLQAAATSILNAVLQQNHALPHVLWALSDIQKVVSVGPLESFASLRSTLYCAASVLFLVGINF